ncbi:phosphoglycerate dehydrogenase [Candidatus Nitronereus thalassa]|uniref:D-3-phosphoglycerate dehydrogenase n=1 Tax=Candidatus Nitronereus thalassa TaxID=3020898 RepID=A0ABU3KBC7_9BACT|nr:phosphoglycerate dehydrogenase [Candidatus Nitronereus thalassa]MDT7043539.1 phosphoglycerate dehydrogenase [Candidatus Nitronereus thalassa]
MKILVSDSLSTRGVEVLQQAGYTADVKTKLSKEELLEEIKNYDGIIVRSATKVTAEVIEAGAQLKIIGRAGSGLDNVDKEAATRRGIVVMNTPGGNTITTAEHTIAMLVAMSRKIPQATASTKAGKWEKSKFMGTELYNKTLGLVGLGQIGTVVTKLAQGLSLNVIGYDPFLASERAKELGIELVELPELFRRSDIISVHTPLTNETRSIINAAAFQQMKDGVMIVNCARGGIVNEQDLFDALQSKKVASAAFDVFEEEPVKPDHPLLSLDNFICSPHIGASTEEAQENVAIAIAEQFVDYFKKGVARGAVNIASVPPEALPMLQPYLGLAERMGLFQAQLIDGAIEGITVEYCGEVSNLTVAPLTVAVLKGLLSPILETVVNTVNAPFIAKKRGIEVKEIKSSDAGEYTSLIRIHVEAGKQTHRLAGTLIHKKDPRIVESNAYPVEVIPEGYMLLIYNVDRPGVIGMVGQILGQFDVNIARMQCARAKKGENALLIIGMDGPPPPKVIETIKQEKDILSVRLVDLTQSP